MSEDNHKLKTYSLWALSWPIFIEQLTEILVIVADSIFLSFVADEAAAAIGVLLPMLMLGGFIIPVFTSAGTSIASQYMGANRHDDVNDVYWTNILLSFGIGIVLYLLFAAFAENLSGIFGMDPSLNHYVQDYFTIVALHFIFLAVRFSYGSVLASKGLTKWNLVASFITHASNILLNIVFVFAFEWGVKGVAIATVLSFALGMLIVMYMVHVKLKISFTIRRSGKAFSSVGPAIVKIGVPSALEPLSYTVQQIIIALFIINLGLSAMIANTYVYRVILLMMAFSWGISLGGQILMAHYVGAKNFVSTNNTFWKCITITSVVSLVYAVVVMLNADLLVGLFSDRPEVIELASWLLVICVIMEPCRAINIVSGQALKGVGDAKFSAVVGMIFMWGIIPVIAVLTLYYDLGLIGIWACFCADEILRAIVNLYRWQSRMWESKGVA